MLNQVVLAALMPAVLAKPIVQTATMHGAHNGRSIFGNAVPVAMADGMTDSSTNVALQNDAATEQGKSFNKSVPKMDPRNMAATQTRDYGRSPEPTVYITPEIAGRELNPDQVAALSAKGGAQTIFDGATAMMTGIAGAVGSGMADGMGHNPHSKREDALPSSTSASASASATVAQASPSASSAASCDCISACADEDGKATQMKCMKTCTQNCDGDNDTTKKDMLGGLLSGSLLDSLQPRDVDPRDYPHQDPPQKYEEKKPDPPKHEKEPHKHKEKKPDPPKHEDKPKDHKEKKPDPPKYKEEPQKYTEKKPDPPKYEAKPQTYTEKKPDPPKYEEKPQKYEQKQPDPPKYETKPNPPKHEEKPQKYEMKAEDVGVRSVDRYPPRPSSKPVHRPAPEPASKPAEPVKIAEGGQEEYESCMKHCKTHNCQHSSVGIDINQCGDTSCEESCAKYREGAKFETEHLVHTPHPKREVSIPEKHREHAVPSHFKAEGHEDYEDCMRNCSSHNCQHSSVGIDLNQCGDTSCEDHCVKYKQAEHASYGKRQIAPVGEVATVPNVPNVPNMPTVPEVPTVPNTPAAPNSPNAPPAPHSPAAPHAPHANAKPGTHDGQTVAEGSAMSEFETCMSQCKTHNCQHSGVGIDIEQCGDTSCEDDCAKYKESAHAEVDKERVKAPGEKLIANPAFAGPKTLIVPNVQEVPVAEAHESQEYQDCMQKCKTHNCQKADVGLDVSQCGDTSCEQNCTKYKAGMDAHVEGEPRPVPAPAPAPKTFPSHHYGELDPY
ncbi:hypothetical protein F5Y05DRAFT_300903 [Hypoxylon sp. FL0543]|nr:hypothetical protein F5Y05DRAFT_300903 [Hypoxylon sp. FL0543]